MEIAARLSQVGKPVKIQKKGNISGRNGGIWHSKGDQSPDAHMTMLTPSQTSNMLGAVCESILGKQTRFSESLWLAPNPLSAETIWFETSRGSLDRLTWASELCRKHSE